MWSRSTERIMHGAIFFKVLVKEAVAQSKIPTACKTFAELPQDSSFIKLITALQHVLNVGRLAKGPKHSATTFQHI